MELPICFIGAKTESLLNTLSLFYIVPYLKALDPLQAFVPGLLKRELNNKRDIAMVKHQFGFFSREFYGLHKWIPMANI